MKKGFLIVYSGPSGVGKGTILKEVLNVKTLKLKYSVSLTSRKPRPGEVDGKDYFFVTKKEFEKAIKNNELLEHATFVDNYYGTPKKYVEEMTNKGYNVLLEIETKGARQIIKKFGDLNVLSIYITPPSIKELKNRLVLRNTEPMEIINKRVAKARRELKNLDLFDYVVVNDDLNKAIKEVKTIIKTEMNKTEHVKSK